MDRMQPPPSYYGAPYPTEQDNVPPSPYPPQMGNYPPGMNPYGQPPIEPPFNGPVRDDSNSTNPTGSSRDIYESFNTLVANNLGKKVNVHCSFTDSTKWHDKEFIGVLASGGDNYIIVYETSSNHHIMIVGVYIDYIEFLDKVVMDGVTSK